jgi:hypothetical protein
MYTDDGENSHRVGNHLRLHVPDAKAKLMVQRAKHEPDENDATTSGASTAETRAHQSLTLHAIETKSDGNVLRPARPTPGTRNAKQIEQHASKQNKIELELGAAMAGATSAAAHPGGAGVVASNFTAPTASTRHVQREMSK